MNFVKRNWCTIPNYFFKKMGGLNFLLRCNYDSKYLNDLPIFYKTILDNFNELKSLHAYNQNQDIIFFNNKEIRADGKPIFLREWFNKGIISIVDLLDESGNLLPFHVPGVLPYIPISNQLSTILSSDQCYP